MLNLSRMSKAIDERTKYLVTGLKGKVKGELIERVHLFPCVRMTSSSTVLFWPMTSCCRLRLRTLESCVLTSYRRTDKWSVCNARRSSMSFSHNLSIQPVK